MDDDDGDGADQGRSGGAAWDWEWGRGAVLRALESALSVDLRALYGGLPGVERMAGLALEMVRTGMPWAGWWHEETP